MSRNRIDHTGAAVLRLTQDDAETEATKAKRKETGLYVATIVCMHTNNAGVRVDVTASLQ